MGCKRYDGCVICVGCKRYDGCVICVGCKRYDGCVICALFQISWQLQTQIAKNRILSDSLLGNKLYIKV